jgi:hypothetical protein
MATGGQRFRCREEDIRMMLIRLTAASGPVMALAGLLMQAEHRALTMPDAVRPLGARGGVERQRNRGYW